MWVVNGAEKDIWPQLCHKKFNITYEYDEALEHDSEQCYFSFFLVMLLLDSICPFVIVVVISCQDCNQHGWNRDKAGTDEVCLSDWS